MSLPIRFALIVLVLSLAIAACEQTTVGTFVPVPDADAPLLATPPAMTVAFDVRPASCPNPFNPRSRGVLPVAILGSEEFDVSDIDATTLLVEGVAPLSARLDDVAAAPPTTPPAPDLEVVSFTGPAAGTLDGTVGFAIQLRIRNAGDLDVTTGFPVGFYVSADPVITTSDRLLIGGREHVSAIFAGVTVPVPLFPGARIAPDSPTGDVYLGVIVDEFDTIPESDETNNTATSAIRIDAPTGIDQDYVLDLQVISVPPDPCECSDDGPDGFMDLKLRLPMPELVAALGPSSPGDVVQLTVSGELLDGTPFTGADCVLVVGRDDSVLRGGTQVQED